MHFTYGEKCEPDRLKQGDLLTRTPELAAVVAEFHSYFANPQYTHFLVLTQTCDLVRRKGNSCKAKYITLAAVRPLDAVIDKFLAEIRSKAMVGKELYCNESNKSKLAEFLRKLLNNTEPHHFFLQAQPAQALPNDSCAFLQLSIPLKSSFHYDTCLSAKRLELTEEFRAKLGWSVGELYSRVGTMDYVPGALPDDAAFSSHIDKLMESYVKWVPSKVFPKFQEFSKQAYEFDEIAAKIEEYIEQTKLNKLNDVVRLVKDVVAVTPEQESELRNRFAQHGPLRGFLE